MLVEDGGVLQVAQVGSSGYDVQARLGQFGQQCLGIPGWREGVVLAHQDECFERHVGQGSGSVGAGGQGQQCAADAPGFVARDHALDPLHEVGLMFHRRGRQNGLGKALRESGHAVAPDGQHAGGTTDLGGVVVGGAFGVGEEQSVEAVWVALHGAQGDVAAHGQAADHGLLNGQVIEQGQQVVHEELDGVLSGPHVALAVPANIIGDGAVAGRQRRQLWGPHVAVEREAVDEDDGRPAVVALDIIAQCVAVEFSLHLCSFQFAAPGAPW